MSVDPMYLCMNQSTHGSTVRRCMENGVWNETYFECTGVNFWTLHHNYYDQVVERRSAESEVHCGYDSSRA